MGDMSASDLLHGSFRVGEPGTTPRGKRDERRVRRKQRMRLRLKRGRGRV